MKSVSLMLSLSLLMISGISAQQKTMTPPRPANNSFAKDFPAATGAKWEKEKGNFEVNFTMNGNKMSAVYDGKGALKETETAIPVASLPAAATNYVQKNYKGVAIKGAAKIIKTGGETVYEAEVNKTDLLFDLNGKFIKSEKD